MRSAGLETLDPPTRQPWDFVERARCRTATSVYRATTPEDLDAVSQLWRAVYGTELGWLSSGATTMIDDRYHAASTYLVARLGDIPVGTMRLVADSPSGLPIEQFTSIDDIRTGRRLLEVQRLMILDQHRNQRSAELPFGVLAGLFKGGLQWALAQGHTHIVADLFTDTATTPIGPLLALGFEETDKRFIDTELAGAGPSIALLLQCGELFSRSFRSDAPFYRYLMEADDVVDVFT